MKKRSIILATALLVCVGAAIFCIKGITQEMADYARASAVYNVPLKPLEVNVPSENTPAAKAPPTKPICAEKLNVGEGQFSQQVAWLESPGTSIDYPVVQGEDNSFYLTHLADGTKNPLGAIFLDTKAQADISSDISVIYGHRVVNGKMFEPLAQYRKEEYFNKHPTMWLCTKDTHYEVQIVAAYRISASDIYPEGFEGEGDFNAFVQKGKEKSFFKSDVTPHFGDKLLVLSTCDYSFENARLTVLARLQPTEHSSEIREEVK